MQISKIKKQDLLKIINQVKGINLLSAQIFSMKGKEIDIVASNKRDYIDQYLERFYNLSCACENNLKKVLDIVLKQAYLSGDFVAFMFEEIEAWENNIVDLTNYANDEYIDLPNPIEIEIEDFIKVF